MTFRYSTPGEDPTKPNNEFRRVFSEQGGFLHIPGFLTSEQLQTFIAAAVTLQPSAKRSKVPGKRQGGAVSRLTIDEYSPAIASFYRSKPLMSLLSVICGEELQVCPSSDLHAYAFYYYTEVGDYIGWHYDRSYYHGRRYTLLIGLRDDSSASLEFILHSKDASREPIEGRLRYGAGDLVFFNGDTLLHRVTPIANNETRISLTFEYVEDVRMSRVRRFLSDLKDAVSYFGFRAVFSSKR